MMLADASNEFAGQWLFISLAVLLGIGTIFAVIGFFATSRELTGVSESQTKLADILQRQNEVNEMRAKELHERINPLEIKVGELRGSTKAFEQSFEKFTRIIEATSRANNETLSAFTKSLDTFASVVERSTRERNRHES